MCGNKLWFSTIDEDFKHSVKLGNDSKMEVMGKGNIRLEINGAVQVVTDVYYVPDLKNNLLSVGQLQERGLTLLIQNWTCKLYHPKRGSNDSENSSFESEEEVVEDTEITSYSNQDTTTSTSSDSSNEDAPVLAERRIRKAPNYLQDYEILQSLPLTKIQTHLKKLKDMRNE
ncbi:hypothetical protein KIW84_064184 [Lathyrus oleraceus]|uniref:Retrovirus-related Pol polyprotein from transposon TNT 1-94-like beta-barrel domain-containing protein n=1 Tax=Pisum sativum TaxID=3888 RepID=A0A9D5A7V1_PEA|nr:hypothetical protein KIW84_064184 [Pisum sativum]